MSYKINKCGCGGSGLLWRSGSGVSIECTLCQSIITLDNDHNTITAWNKANPETAREIVEMLEKHYARNWADFYGAIELIKQKYGV